jgi:hypothetical protein
MMAKKWWIKERHNPQLGVYYVGMGQISKAEAMRYENTLHGTNYMLSFDSEEAYNAKLAELKANGRKIV